MGQVVFDVPILSDASIGDAINVGGDEIDRLASSGCVEDWRHTPQVQPIRCSPFPLGVPHEPNRQLVSSPPRHFKPIVPISSNGLTSSLPIKGYVTDSATCLNAAVSPAN